MGGKSTQEINQIKAKQTSLGWYDKLTTSPINLLIFVVSWATILLVISPLVGIPWSQLGDFNFRTLMYYHAIMLPTVGVLICLVSLVMNIGGEVSKLLRYSLIPAIVLAGLGSFFIFSITDTIPVWMQIVGMLVLDEMAIALIWGLMMLPRKLGMAYRAMNLSYWAITLFVILAFLAALFGHASGVGVDWGWGWIPGILTYLASQGLTGSSFTANLVTSHSHEMLPSVMGGTVVLTMVWFGYDKKLKGGYKMAADIGLAIMIFGGLIYTILYVWSGLTGWPIPTILTGGPGGVNGLALDDLSTGFVALGSLIAIAPLATIGIEGIGASIRSSIRDPLRISIFLSWILAIISIAGVGYPIEFNEVFYGAGVPPAAGYLNDLAFTRAHLLSGFFIFVILAAFLLALDIFYRKSGFKLNLTLAPALAIAGMLITVTGEVIWVITMNMIIFFVGWSICILSIASIAYYLFALRRSAANQIGWG